MDVIDLLRHQVRDTYAWLEMTLEDVSEAQANWNPPGTANSIAAVYAHTIIAADVGFSTQIHGIMPLIAASYGGRIGLSEMAQPLRDWNAWASRMQADWSLLRRYGRDVKEHVERLVDAATEEHLEKPIDMTPVGLGIWKGVDIFNLHGINHIRIHGGEIACLKGLQGGRGWSVGPVYP